MKRGWIKVVFFLSFVFCLTFALSITSSAATYEPDGATVTQYEYASSECNRTIVVSCVDESGKLIKKVNIKTKYGKDDLCYVSIYNYNPIAFSSDQGLWETCKLMWTSGGMHCEGNIDIDYYFRTAMSQKTINVTVKMRPFDQITIKEKTYKEQYSGTNGSTRNYVLYNSKTTKLYCGDYFSTKAQNITGYTLSKEYFSSLSGNWSMSMFGKPKNMGSVLDSMEWDIVNKTWKMDGDDYPRWVSFDETKNGSLGYMKNRVITIEYRYTVNSCTITFNANGGKGAPSSITWWYGHKITIPSGIPTRTGYTFQGWGTTTTDTTPNYTPGKTATMGNSQTVYAIWKLNSYTVSFNNNGGSGAPSSQTKTYGVTLTLSSTIPTRSGYDFLGWSTSSTATSATYSAGGSYTANADATLYAVWERVNYEFSISDLIVSDSEPYRYGTITVKVRTDSWDKKNPYSDMPVQLYYDGQLMSTQYVDFAAYGVANLTFTLYVGDTPGNRSIEARINWSNRENETNTENNRVTTSISVQDFDYEMSIDDITMSESYCEGETVISSFTVINYSDYDITPDKGNVAHFAAYYYNGSQKVVIATDTWNNVVIPSGKTNLVFFKWTVPLNLAGKTVYCECTINHDAAVNEENRDNNTATFSTTIASLEDSQTPNTRYESIAPGSYKGYSVPANSTDKATWTMWVYENNQFVMKSYGVQISTTSPIITPSDDCKTAIYANGKWTIRSGYGFTISYTPTVVTISGYDNPGSSAYTSVQSVYAMFPEFNYEVISGNFRTLECVNGTWQLVQNNNAANDGRIHFIPVWYSDGEYSVAVTATRVWTPIGVISNTISANTLIIDGSIYDDYFVGN